MRPPFPNLDAEWLASLGETFLADEDIATGMRLLAAARNLQALDDRLALASQDGGYAHGYKAAMERIYERSNLPPGERTVGRQVAEVLNLKDVPVRRIEAPKRPAPVNKYAKLSLKVNL